MSRTRLSLLLTVMLVFACERDKEVIPLGSKPCTFKNETGTCSIKIYYDNDLVSCIVMVNTSGDVISFPEWGFADSIEWFYSNGKLDHGVSHKRQDASAPWQYWGYLPGSARTGKIYLTRDGNGRVVEKTDSLAKNIITRYNYDSLGRFTGTGGLLADTLHYRGENVSKSSNTGGYTDYLDYDNTYNPYWIINDLLGFPFFPLGVHNSKNNCKGIRTVFGNGETVARDIPLQYDGKNRVVRIDIGRIIEYAD